MAKLHELLAVEGQLKGQAKATGTELRATFEKKRHLFEEKRVTFHPSGEGQEPKTEQQSDLQSKVPDELAWITEIWAKAMDVSYKVAVANTLARADVVLDGATILTNVPATALLELEKRLGEAQELVLAVPTLDPAKGFQLDADRGKDVYRARERSGERTKKVQQPIVLFPATPEHPAQTQLISVDIPVGRVVEQEWSGLVTPAQKGDMLSRVEALRRAVKQALTRANAVEVPETQDVGAALLNRVFGL